MKCWRHCTKTGSSLEGRLLLHCLSASSKDCGMKRWPLWHFLNSRLLHLLIHLWHTQVILLLDGDSETLSRPSMHGTWLTPWQCSTGALASKNFYLFLYFLAQVNGWMQRRISQHMYGPGVKWKYSTYQLFGAWTENREGDLWFHFSLEKLAAKKRDLWKGKIYTPVKMALKVKLPAGVPGWKLQLREVKMAKGVATFVISRGEDFLWTEFVVLVPESQEETIFKLRWAWA